MVGLDVKSGPSSSKSRKGRKNNKEEGLQGRRSYLG